MFLIPGMVAYALAQKTGSGIVMDITNTHDTDGAFAMMVKTYCPQVSKVLLLSDLSAPLLHLWPHSSIAALPYLQKISINL